MYFWTPRDSPDSSAFLPMCILWLPILVPLVLVVLLVLVLWWSSKNDIKTRWLHSLSSVGESQGRAQWWGKPFPLAIHFLFITLHRCIWNLVSGFFYWGRLWCWLSVMRRNLQKSRCIWIYNIMVSFWIGSICILWIKINSNIESVVKESELKNLVKPTPGADLK